MLYSLMGECDFECNSLHFGHNCDVRFSLLFTRHFAMLHHTVWDSEIVIK
jgi:hypothetical protein